MTRNSLTVSERTNRSEAAYSSTNIIIIASRTKCDISRYYEFSFRKITKIAKKTSAVRKHFHVCYNRMTPIPNHDILAEVS